MALMPNEFKDVDTNPDPESTVNALGAMSQLASVKRIRRFSLELLNLKQGQRLFEAGCGACPDLDEIIELLKPEGRVLCYDKSEAMLTQAQKDWFTPQDSVDFVQGDLNQIDFPDCAFDCCRVMRTLQHVADPEKALDEIFRIVKIGGRIVAWEPNWRSFVISSSFQECADKFLKNWANGILNPTMGQQLKELFEKKNANNIDVHIIPRISHTLSEGEIAYSITSRTRAMINEGSILTEEGEAFLEDLRERDKKGEFFCSVDSFVVLGEKGIAQ